jgi:queuine/archaeosine tRNA-ribosyltransferase
MNRKAKAHARYVTRKLIAQDEIDPPDACEICDDKPAELHHIDYADPARVMRLCHLHHMQTHSQFGKPAPLDWMADIRAAQRRIDEARARLRAAQSGGEIDL